MKKEFKKLLIVISVLSICLNFSIFLGYVKIEKKIVVERSNNGVIQTYEDIEDVEELTNKAILEKLVEKNKISENEFNKKRYIYGETKRMKIYQYDNIIIKWEK